MPGSPLDPRAEGTNDLLKQGATICTRAEDVVTALEPMRSRDLFSALEEGDPSEPLRGEGRPLRRRRRRRSERRPSSRAAWPESRPIASTPSRDRIVALLGPSPIALDDLARAAEASARETRVALMELELAGRIEFSGGDRVAARSRRSPAERAESLSVTPERGRMPKGSALRDPRSPASSSGIVGSGSAVVRTNNSASALAMPRK